MIIAFKQIVSLMKKIVVLICLLVMVKGAIAQRNYYVGIPFHVACLKDSARFVIADLPWNWNGRLLEKEMPRYLAPLKQFMASHPGYKCNILLYDFEPSEDKRLAFTSFQAKHLAAYFENVDTLFGHQYLNEIIPHSTYHPLFKNIQADSSQRLYRAEANISIKSSVIIELIRQYPIQRAAMESAYYAKPCGDNEVDIEPSFPGGVKGLYEFLAQRMDYSVVGQFDVTGVVLVEFTIGADGRVSSPELKNRLFPALDKQSEKIVSEMPQWIPAFKDGKAVNCCYRIPMWWFPQ